MNCVRQHVGTFRIAASALTTLTLFILTAGANLPLQAQTEPIDRHTPAVTHNTWTSGSPMPTAAFLTAVGVLKGQIYVVGGCTVPGGGVIADTQIYDPATNTWTAGVSLPTPLCDGTAAVVKNVLYVFGGTPSGSAQNYTNAVWAYSPKTKTWSSKAAMPTIRGDMAAVVEKNIVYVIGGNATDGSRLNTVESYNPATNTWTEEVPLLAGKAEPSVGLIGTTIVAADGYETSGDFGDNEAYDATTNTWTSLASDPTARNGACGGAIGPYMYVAGGYYDGNPDLTLTESFKLSKDTWKTLAPMPQATWVGGSAVYKGQLYCLGGATNQEDALNYVQIYQP
ncbi:MAG: kelch repeat-containing protein [Terriglobales bacterium]|jgi:Kelch motif protein